MKCAIRDCNEEPVFYITSVENRRVESEAHLCDKHAKEFFDEFRSSTQLVKGPDNQRLGEVCVDFELIAFHQGPEDMPVCVYLHEINGHRRFATMVDGWAWWALMSQLNGSPSPTPLTHVAWSNTIKHFNGTIRDVSIDFGISGDSWHNTWYSAKLRIDNGHALAAEIDVRASDAYIMALIHNAPIFVTEALLQHAVDLGPTM